jgi:hypothetical protein
MESTPKDGRRRLGPYVRGSGLVGNKRAVLRVPGEFYQRTGR